MYIYITLQFLQSIFFSLDSFNSLIVTFVLFPISFSYLPIIRHANSISTMSSSSPFSFVFGAGASSSSSSSSSNPNPVPPSSGVSNTGSAGQFTFGATSISVQNHLEEQVKELQAKLKIARDAIEAQRKQITDAD